MYKFILTLLITIIINFVPYSNYAQQWSNPINISNSIDTDGLRPPGLDFSHVKIDDWLQLLPNDGRHLHHYDVTYGIITLVPPHE